MLNRVDTPLAMLLLFSLVVKIILVYQADIINPDGIRYINSAHQLFQGNVALAFSHEKMLGFTFLLGLFHVIIPDWFLAGKILSVVAMVLTTIPLYLITRELFGKRAALYAGLAYSLAPAINGKVDSIIKDPPFLFLTVMIVWLVILSLKESRLRLLLFAGLLCCLSVLIRPEGIVLFLSLVLFFVTLIILSRENRAFHIRSLAVLCVFPVTCALLSSVPFLMGMISPESMDKIAVRFSYYFTTDLTKTYKMIFQHLETVEKSFPGGADTHDFFEYARSNLPLIYLLGMLQTFFEKLFPVFVVPLLFGLKLKGRWSKGLVLFLSVLVTFLLMDYVFLLSRNFIASRYFLVPVSLSFVFVGYGMDRMTGCISNLRYRRSAIAIIVVLCVLLPLGRAIERGTREKDEIKKAGLWLSENKPNIQSHLLVNDERITYYAGLLRGDYLTIGYDQIDKIEQRALNNNCEIIVVYLNKTDFDRVPDLKEFELIETFSGRKKIAMVYERHI